MSTEYLSQLTSCKVNSPPSHPAYHDAATIDEESPVCVFEGALGAVPVLVVVGLPVGEATAESLDGAAHASWAVMKM
jgi:hypothetical protein